MVYSCAYFRTGDESLDEAQRAKLDHICRKLRLAPGERLLDVGCGWGLVIHAAQNYGVSAVGITLSKEQHALARERVAARGLGDRVAIELLDYRELPDRYGRESFDKAASVGMFEHVGLKNLGRYFGTVAAMLRDRGLFLNHGITASDIDHRPVGSGVATSSASTSSRTANCRTCTSRCARCRRPRSRSSTSSRCARTTRGR